MPNLAHPTVEDAMAVTISEQVKQFGLETHVLGLEVDGLTVVPRRYTVSPWTASTAWWNCSWPSRRR